MNEKTALCKSCFTPIFFNEKTGVWLHYNTLASLCECVADPYDRKHYDEIKITMDGATSSGSILNVKNEKMGLFYHRELTRKRGFACIGLDNPKIQENVGSSIRAVGLFDAAFIAISGKRYSKSPTDTMKFYRHYPVLQVDDLHSVIPFDCVPIAVDLIEGAIPLPEYNHPERAFYIFGAEDSTLGKRITDWCRDKIYIPMEGCMNLAATVNVVLYDRLAKSYKINT